jgi:hypothetical protein
MRSRVLIPAALAVISLLVLVPASAFAHKHRSPSGRCALSMYVSPHHIHAGDEVVIFGRLRCSNPANDANQEVKLFHHLAGLPGFSVAQSTTTDSVGFYEFSPADAPVETNRSWFVLSHGARSATKRVKVDAQVTLSGPTEGQLLTGFPNRVTFTGSVSPADIGARVILQRQNSLTGNEWHRIDSGVVVASGTSGAFTIVHTFIVPGDANIRVLVRSQGRNIPSESNELSYSISQAQNPALTIQASADPISFGEAVTISGKLTTGSNEPVTLLARNRRQHGFIRVAQVTTNAAGEYSFAAQAPVNSTFYRVQADTPLCPPPAPGSVSCAAMRRVSSAVLYEGVKDVLTTQVSPTTVQAGQSVTVTGTVTPDHTGHIIYLERANAHSPGFHVIQVAFIGAGSAYSIIHQLYDPGTKVLRVHIPGGPENQGAASPPFTVDVTPAPASALMPELPESSTLPPEGQS